MMVSATTYYPANSAVPEDFEASVVKPALVGRLIEKKVWCLGMCKKQEE